MGSDFAQESISDRLLGDLEAVLGEVALHHPCGGLVSWRGQLSFAVLENELLGADEPIAPPRPAQLDPLLVVNPLHLNRSLDVFTLILP